MRLASVLWAPPPRRSEASRRASPPPSRGSAAQLRGCSRSAACRPRGCWSPEVAPRATCRTRWTASPRRPARRLPASPLLRRQIPPRSALACAWRSWRAQRSSTGAWAPSRALRRMAASCSRWTATRSRPAPLRCTTSARRRRLLASPPPWRQSPPPRSALACAWRSWRAQRSSTGAWAPSRALRRMAASCSRWTATRSRPAPLRCTTSARRRRRLCLTRCLPPTPPTSASTRRASLQARRREWGA